MTTLRNLVRPVADQKEIDGFQLMVEREKRGLSQQRFAELCGHTQPYQAEIERPGWHKINTDKAVKILRVFRKYK